MRGGGGAAGAWDGGWGFEILVVALGLGGSGGFEVRWWVC